MSSRSQVASPIASTLHAGLERASRRAIAPFIEAPIREPTTLILGVFVFQVIVIVSIGFLLWFWVLSIYPLSNMASFGLLTPIFGVFFGWIIFGDPITPALAISLLFAGGGIVLINRPVSQIDLSESNRDRT